MAFSCSNSDHVGACGGFDRLSFLCGGVYDELVPQLLFLFLQNTYVHDALEDADTKMSVFFDRQCNFRRSQDCPSCRLLSLVP